jgi:formiminoglutamate deiminase
MTDYWCERAWLGGGPVEHVLVRTDDGDTITSVEIGAPPQGHRLPGMVFPGFANGHSHAFHRALRGRTHADGGTFWTWRDAVYRLAGLLDPARYHRLARLVYAEMALAGYTAVGEFHYLHHAPDGTHYADPNAMGQALIEAAHDAGIRITLLDTLYLAGGLDATGYQPLSGPQLRFGDGDLDAWLDRTVALVSTPFARIGAALHSVRAVPAAVLPTFAGFTRDLPVHVHLSEQPAENEACQAYHGCSPTELLSSAGVLGPWTTAVHATHLSTADIKLLGTCFSCLCPTTEADLADGIGPARDLADAGSNITLGSDQHVVLDPFAEARALEYGERLRTGRRGRFTPASLVAAATHHGYSSIGWPGGGRIAVGAPCDLVAVRTDSVRTAGAAADQLIMAAGASDVDTVVIGGRLVVQDSRHLTITDVGRELAECIEELWI